MRFSDSINYDINIPKPIKYANSDSSPFNSDESLSDDPSSSDDQNPSQNDLFQNSSNTYPLSIITSLFSNKTLRLLIIINFLTEPVTHLKTNQHLPILQKIEIPKLVKT